MIPSRVLTTTRIFLLLFALALFSCAKSDPDSGDGKSGAAPGKPVVHAVNYPLAYFAGRIGGDRIDVEFIVPAGEDPAFWEPGDADVSAMQDADLILLNGATYAKWLGHVSLPESTRVDTSAGFSGRYIEVAQDGTHSHGKEGEHSHAGTAFTTWIDLSQARLQAEAVRDALARLVPKAKSEFEANAAGLLGEIDQLDAGLKAIGAAIGDRPLVASHPVYQYFARRYGLNIQSVLWEPETVPDGEAMAALQNLLGEHAAGWMIWEGDPAAESVSKLEAIGIKSVVFDPCGNRPEGGDWLAVMRRNVENLKAIGGS